jgi:hypothetical protein
VDLDEELINGPSKEKEAESAGEDCEMDTSRLRLLWTEEETLQSTAEAEVQDDEMQADQATLVLAQRSLDENLKPKNVMLEDPELGAFRLLLESTCGISKQNSDDNTEL